jgi:hypothetical protein
LSENGLEKAAAIAEDEIRAKVELGAIGRSTFSASFGNSNSGAI